MTQDITLKGEIEYALWKITGMPIQFTPATIPYLSQEIAKTTGTDSALVALWLIDQIKMIVNADLTATLTRTGVPA